MRPIGADLILRRGVRVPHGTCSLRLDAPVKKRPGRAKHLPNSRTSAHDSQFHAWGLLIPIPIQLCCVMVADGSSSQLLLKRRRLAIPDPMEAEPAKAKLAEMKAKFGREIRVFETSVSSPTQNAVPDTGETDDFYEFTAEDYHRLLTTKKEEKYLKTRKLREAEEAARRSRMTKSVIRVRFPDNHTLEATFHPSETIESLVDLLEKVVAKPELPFYIYTTPPKKQIKDLSEDFYSAGFIPGAIVYFSYDTQKASNEDIAAAEMGPFLQEYVMALKGLEHNIEKVEPVQSASEPVEPAPPPVVLERKPAEKKPVKPKWLKM